MNSYKNLSTCMPSCPICKSDGNFFKEFKEHILYKCNSCKSLFYSPSPIMYYDKLLLSWNSPKWYVERGANPLFYAEVIEYVRNVISKEFPKRNAGTIDVLEVGCSYGFLMDMAASLFNWNVTGVDQSPCSRKGAQELGIEIINSCVENISIDRQYDIIIAAEVIEHTSNSYDFLKQISKLLKREGIIVFTTPDAAAEDLGAHYAPGEHYIIYSQKGLESLLNKTGFCYHRFFPMKTHKAIFVVAGKSALSAKPESYFKSDGIAAFIGTVLEYINKKKHLCRNSKSLSTGLYFRLIELLINKDRYSEARYNVNTLEKLMGSEKHRSHYSFIIHNFVKMLSAKNPEDYVSAGPGFFAPYLLCKGILSLKSRKDRAAANKYFNLASQLFEHEIQEFGLVQYEPLVEIARSHAGTMEMDIEKNKAPGNGLHKEGRSVLAAPFIKDGISEFCANVPMGRLRRIGIKNDESFIFTLTCLEDNLSGVSFNIMVLPHLREGLLKLSLDVFEEYNPVSLRKSSLVTKIDLQDTLRIRSQKIIEILQFESIPESRGKTFTFVLGIGGGIRKASLLCSSLKGASTVAGYRQHNNIQPVIVPYYKVKVNYLKHFDEKDSPLVSCLILTYNSENYIRNCLSSITFQDYPNIEVVVIDNHSSDRTADIVREEFSHVNLFVMEKNLEFCRGNNFGLSKCTGKFICILNADVVLREGAVRRFVEHIEISPYIAIVGATIETKGSITRYADTFLIDGLVMSSEKLLQGERFSSAPCGAGFLIRRSVVDKLGYLFDEGFISNWEDHDLGLRCWLHGYFVLHIPELALYHDGGGAYGLVNPRRESLVLRNCLLTYFKNYGKLFFLKAFLKTVRYCTWPHGIFGIIRFFGSFWRYIPERIAIQRKSKINDTILQILASGVPAIIPDHKSKEGHGQDI